MTNLTTRSGTSDERSLKELSAYKHIPTVKGLRVLDIGGHIGGFTDWALNEGAAKVKVYEPEPDNYRVLCLNTQDRPVVRVNKAITGDGRDVILNVKTSGHTGGHSIVYNGPTREQITVESEPFDRVVRKFRPDVIKIDCEGAEYEFGLPKSLPKFVRYVAIEIHLQRRELREQGLSLVESFNKYYDPIREPRISDKAWACVGVWGRK